MVKNQFIRLSLILAIVTIGVGCSFLTRKDAFLPSPKSDGWIKIIEENNLYKYEYICQDDSLRIRELSIGGGFGLFGFPIIPLIPVFVLEGHANLYLDIHMSSKKELPRNPINIELKLPDQEQALLPIDVFPVQKDFGRLEKEGIYHTDFIVAEDGRFGITYIYKFDIDKKKIKYFEVIFEPYKRCNIPNLSYNRTGVIRYEPFTLPFD